MQREKLFFSTIYLVISLFASLASIPLLFVVIPDSRLAAQIGIGVFIAFPVVSLTLLWRTQFASVYLLRRVSFLLWGALITLLGIGNTALPKSAQSPYGNLIIFGLALIAMSMYVRRKELSRLAKAQSQDTK